jgi:Enoyl-CoA hydratase/isomerase
VFIYEVLGRTWESTVQHFLKHIKARSREDSTKSRRRRRRSKNIKLEMAIPLPNCKFFNVSMPAEYVAHLEINRPDKLNAFYERMWQEMRTVLELLSSSPDVRCVLFSGAGPRAFTTGEGNTRVSSLRTL